MDVRDLRSGEFDQSLSDKIAAVTDFVVLVTPNCFNRCDNDDDWFRREIENALDAGCNVVPLRTEEAQLPEPDNLPGSLAKLPKHQCVTFSSEFCDAGMERLSQLLKSQPRRSPLLPVAVGVGLVLVLLVALYFLSSGDDATLARSESNTKPLVLHWHGFGQREVGKDLWERFAVTDGMTMYNGDQFRLVFSPDSDCYVYVVNVDSGGAPSVMFPNVVIQQDHFCRANEYYQIPDANNWFTLDDNTGTETTYLLASLEKLEPIETILKTHDAADATQVAQTLNETADLVMDETRGYNVKADRRVATTTASDGQQFEHEMSYVAGQARAVHIIKFQHEAAMR